MNYYRSLSTLMSHFGSIQNSISSKVYCTCTIIWAFSSATFIRDRLILTTHIRKYSYEIFHCLTMEIQYIITSLSHCLTPAAWNDNKDVISYYGLVAPGLGVDKVHIRVFLFARDRQVVVTPPCHHGGLLLLQAAWVLTSQGRRTWERNREMDLALAVCVILKIATSMLNLKALFQAAL